MNKTEALKKLWLLLTGLIEEKARITRLAHQSGLPTAQINPDGAAAEYWWRVLVEAHRRRKVDKIVAGVGGEIPERKGELEEAYRLYADAAGDVDETPPAPAKTPISSAHREYLHSLFDRWGAVSLADILEELAAPVRLLEVYVPLPLDVRVEMRGARGDKPKEWWFERGGPAPDADGTAQAAKRAGPQDRPRIWPELGINDVAQIEPWVEQLWVAARTGAERDTAVVSVPLDAEHAAALQPHLVLLGGPGSGKSSFLRHLMLCLAGAVLRAAGETPKDAANLARLPGWRAGAYTPIYIELRELVKRFPPLPDRRRADTLLKLPTIDVFWAYLDDTLRGLDNIVLEMRSLLRTGKVMVLLDGLDEANRAHDPARLSQVTALVAALQNAGAARILIASRPHAYEEGNVPLPDFGVMRLAPLPRARQALLASTLLRQLPAAGSADDLMDAIDRAQVSDDMRENPLFLTLWVGLWHVGASQPLPATRAGLYRAAVNLLLWRWTRPKEPDPAVIDAIGIEPPALRPVLEALACETLKQQDEDFALKDLLDLLEKAKSAEVGSYPDEMIIDKVDDYLEQHAGILVAPRKRHYRFLHRSFQEHLAACELIHRTSPAGRPLPVPAERLFPHGLVAKLQQDTGNWRNVARLAISELIADSRQLDLEALLEAMSEPYAKDGCSWPAVALLALEMVNDPELPELPERCAHVLRSAALRALHDVTAFPVPKERAAAGNALSRLGDPRPGVGINDRGLPDIVWMPVSAGEFSMGSNDYDDEKPIHPVYLDAFEIAKYPVTNSQYACFVAATGRKPPAHWGGATPPEGLRTHPVVYVSWEDAAAFCAWLDEQEKATIRLPTEAEWEKAARGTDGRKYPWGNDFDKTLCNMGGTGIGGTSPVGIFPAGESPYEVAEMAGNVREWVHDWYDSEYYSVSPAKNPQGPATGKYRVLRGGSWLNNDYSVRSASRGPDSPDYWSYSGSGFRCVRSL